MATFGTSDDERELEEIRNLLLGGNRQEEAPPTPAASSSGRSTAAPVAPPPEPQDPAPVDVDARPVVPPGLDAAPVVSPPTADAEPRPSFTSVRPRSTAPAVRPEPARRRAPVPAPAPVDATPGDVDVDNPAAETAAATSAIRQVDQLSPAALEELSNVLGGVSVDQIQQMLTKNPQLLGDTTAASADTTVTPAAVAGPRADTSTESPAPADTALTRSDLATQGWRAWLVKMGIPIRKGSAERYADMMDVVHEVIRRDLGQSVVIGVSSYRGGSGKTSAAILMARWLAEIRGESVVVLDADLFGTLMARSVGEDHAARGSGMTMASLAAALRSGGGDVTRMVWDGGNGYVFVPGSATFRANEIDVDGYRMVVEAVRQVYPIVLVDMAVLDENALYDAVLDSLDGLVMMSSTVEGGVGFLYNTQAELQHRGVDHLNSHRISALNNLTAGRSEVDVADFARGLKVRDNRDVAEIPYDRHLAASRVIDTAQIAASTKTAVVLTLAALIDTFDAKKTN